MQTPTRSEATRTHQTTLRRLAGLALVAALLAGCASSEKTRSAHGIATPSSPPPVLRSPADLVAERLAGSYSSAAQAALDSEFFDVRLHMAPIWPERADGRWLYVEQAMATALDKPYRQRIYCVTDAGDGTVLSAVYELPNAAARVGAWRTPEVFANDDPALLTKRDGCVIRLAHAPASPAAPGTADAWIGSTNGRDCLSSLRGATYATSEVRLYADRIETWDRGFDANDQQVWGAKKGPYRFVRE